MRGKGLRAGAGVRRDQGRGATPRRYLLVSVDHALALLETFSREAPDMGVTELSARLRLAKSTISRLLATPAARGYVRRNPATGKYRLGLKPFEIGAVAASQLNVREAALPFLERLRDATRETVHLGVRDATEVVYVEKIESPQTIRMYSRIGRRAPLHCTALGKALLAFLPPDEGRRILGRGLRRYTGNTLTSTRAVVAALAEIREQGYALDREEFEEGLRCVAAPIRDYTGTVVASAGIAGPAVRITEARLPEFIKAVTGATQAISAQLGHRRGPSGA
jgi:DNA-binding IclR family transcriptional regulator